jgi:CcmD family protein
MQLLNFIQSPEMADLLRQDGKFWVVIGVVFLVLAGFIAYLVSIDLKLSKIEKSLKK